MRYVSLACMVAIATAPVQAVAAEALPPGASSCRNCHGSGSTEPGMADLSSLPPEAIVSAMAAYRTGQRPGTLMPRIAQGFSDAETRAIAAALGRGR